MADRIRWNDDGFATFTGHIGTLNPHAFQIWKPLGDEGEWVLTAALPGMGNVARYGDGPEALKPEAERLLAQFVASLGAVFPDGGGHPVTSRCDCGGLARHVDRCRWRQGYGSVVVEPAEHPSPAGEKR